MSQTSVTAYCPGHISGYFKRVAGADLASTGSLGAGIVISEGVTATVTPSETTSVCIRQFSPGAGKPRPRLMYPPRSRLS
nr:hypothetical protein [uncultured Methanoregula sp.]